MSADDDTATIEPSHLAEATARWRAGDPAFARWAAGLRSDPPRRPHAVAHAAGSSSVWRARGIGGDGVEPYALLAAADRLAAAGIWLTVHQTYAARVHLDGRALAADDFKHDPQGHLGGALNIVPGYVGYLAANALTGRTRSWLDGPGPLRRRRSTA